MKVFLELRKRRKGGEIKENKKKKEKVLYLSFFAKSLSVLQFQMRSPLHVQMMFCALPLLPPSPSLSAEVTSSLGRALCSCRWFFFPEMTQTPTHSANLPGGHCRCEGARNKADSSGKGGNVGHYSHLPRPCEVTGLLENQVRSLQPDRLTRQSKTKVFYFPYYTVLITCWCSLPRW